MNKQEILEVLQEAQTMYERAFNCRIRTVKTYIEMLSDNEMDFGLCGFFVVKNCIKHRDILINELRIDFSNGVISYKVFWYHIIYDREKLDITINWIKNHCILPRLNHLNRTIARLEKELQTTPQP